MSFLSPPHSLEKCLLFYYLNKLNIPTPNSARANNENRDQFQILLSYLLILSIPTSLFWHPLLRFSFNNKVHRCVDVCVQTHNVEQNV